MRHSRLGDMHGVSAPVSAGNSGRGSSLRATSTGRSSPNRSSKRARSDPRHRCYWSSSEYVFEGASSLVLWQQLPLRGIGIAAGLGPAFDHERVAAISPLWVGPKRRPPASGAAEEKCRSRLSMTVIDHHTKSPHRLLPLVSPHLPGGAAGHVTQSSRACIHGREENEAAFHPREAKS